MAKNDLTAVILTRNEEKRLAGCLKNLAFVDYLLVVDDGSTDKTIEIAKSFGAEVFKRRLDNFGSQRNYALTKVKTEWVLLVDPDEKVTKLLAEEIKKKIASKKENGFFIPRKNIIFGQWIKHSGWFPDKQLHLFRTKKGRYIRQVHEQVEVEGRVGELKNYLFHDNYQTISQYLKKMNLYTSLEAENQISSGYQFSLADLFAKPTDEFLRRYFAEKGFLDGLHGLTLCALQAFSEFIVCLKVWEKEGFEKREINWQELEKEASVQAKKLIHWLAQLKIGKAKPLKRTLLRLRRKIARL